VLVLLRYYYYNLYYIGKNATQQRLPFTLNPRLLYRGLAASITNMAVLTGIQFFATGKIAGMFTGNTPRPLNSSETIAAAFMGGAISGIACGPMELVMIQQQRHGGTIIGTPFRLLKDFGISGIFRGVTPAIGREALFTCGYLGVGPVLNSTLKNQFPNGNPFVLQMTAAIITAFPASFLSHPMDTIKTCMQGDMERATYKTFTKSCVVVYNQGGIGRFFRGYGFRYGRMVLDVYILNKAKEIIAPILYPQYF